VAAPAVEAPAEEVVADETPVDEGSVAEASGEEAPADQAPTVAEQAPDVLSDTAQGTAPQTSEPPVSNASPSDAPEPLAAPTAAPDAGAVDVAADTPVLPNPQSLAPQAPTSDAPARVDTASADPLPEPAPTIVDDAPVANDAPDQGAPGPDVVAVADDALLTPQSPLAPAAPEAGDTADIAGTDAPSTDPAQADAANDAPVVVAIVDEPDSASALPTGTAGVRVNRLTGGDDGDDAATEEVVAEVFPEGVAFPVTVMLNPSTPDVTDRMTAYRAAGIEVGVLAALPASARPADVEVFFEAAFASLPETTVVLDAGEAGLQADEAVISQAIAALAEDGRGLLTVSRGLNTALRTAEAQGVPTGIIFRNLDADGQDARVIRRFMDQAAFRARQESGVILLGQIRADTISALIQWGAANRASQVAMVPISKVLQDD